MMRISQQPMRVYETIEEYAANRGDWTAEQIRGFVDEACRGIASGHTLTSLCKRSRTLPSAPEMFELQMLCAEARVKILLARQTGAHAMVDRSIDIPMDADDKSAKIARVRSQALQWAAERHDRRHFGHMVQHQVEGSIDLRAAIDAGRRRAELMRPIRDITPPPIPQLVDNTKYIEPAVTDVNSLTDVLRVKDRSVKPMKGRQQKLKAAAKRDSEIPW